MTDPHLFDAYAEGYDRTVQDAIGASGESVEYFVNLKTRLTKDRVSSSNVRQILDFGCGIGNTTRSLAEHFAQANVVGFDTSRESIKNAENAANPCDRVSYASTDERRLPFEDAAFELVFASCVFHHIEPIDRSTWMSELYRVTARGGLIIIFEHNPLNPFTRQVVRNCPFDEGVVLLSPWRTRRLLSKAGFASKAPRFYFFFPNVMRYLRPLEFGMQWIPLGAQYFVVGTR